MSLGTRILTMIAGEQVGEDDQGNRYYRDQNRKRNGREKRWVVYNGKVEASAVPAEWHGWLHHRTDEMPDGSTASARKSWQRDHEANPTGTAAAYRPPGHVLQGGKRDKATGDYEAWRPDQD